MSEIVFLNDVGGFWALDIPLFLIVLHITYFLFFWITHSVASSPNTFGNFSRSLVIRS